MKKSISIFIPQPCHEDWQQMTPVDKGRFCQSCAKQVVDFSPMTDQEILNYISKAPGRLCGRFADDQLQRPLQPVKHGRKKIWWVAAVMPLMTMFGKVGAQKKKVSKEHAVSATHFQFRRTMGLVAAPAKPVGHTGDIIRTLTEVKGKVLSGSGEVLPFASIRAVNQAVFAMADSTGGFSIRVYAPGDIIHIEASAIGYENARIDVRPDEQNEVILILKETEIKLPNVTVRSDGLQSLMGFAGGLQVIRKDTYAEKFDTLIRQIFHAETFKIFPNPVQRGQSITIDTKNEGEYSIQLFTNSGKLLQVKEFDAMEGATQTLFNIPPTATAGMYYIRLEDNKTKKQFTDKIVVM